MKKIELFGNGNLDSFEVIEKSDNTATVKCPVCGKNVEMEFHTGVYGGFLIENWTGECPGEHDADKVRQLQYPPFGRPKLIILVVE